MANVSILGLPTEVLNQILEHVIPVTRLARHAFLDAQWERHPAEPRSVPSVLFVNKQFHQHAGNIFYSKAILELAPIKPPSYILNAPGGPDAAMDLAVALDIAFASVAPQYLTAIRRVFLYSDQRDAISAEGYESTLRWLIERTGVTTVFLSRRLMTRLRKFRVDIDLAHDFITRQSKAIPSRIIEVVAIHPRSYWETQRMRELVKAQGNIFPTCQYYLSGPGAPVLLDLRWDARNSDDGQMRERRGEVASYIDQVAVDNPRSHGTCDWAWAPCCFGEGEKPWLYQVLFIFGS